MPLQNRVDPYGHLYVTPTRGLFFGNRGVLHGPDGQIRRERSAERRWLICLTEFKGRRRALLQPGRYTELFFLDEAVALSAGHRPCVECRRADFVAFVTALGEPALRASDLDRRLDDERGRPVPVTRSLADLPDGTFVEREGRPLLVHAGQLLPWSPSGYGPRQERFGGVADGGGHPSGVGRSAADGTSFDPVAGSAVEHTGLRVLTPATSVRALEGGYRPVLHPSANDGGPGGEPGSAGGADAGRDNRAGAARPQLPGTGSGTS